MPKDDEAGSPLGHTATTHSILCRRHERSIPDYLNILALEKRCRERLSSPILPEGHAYWAMVEITMLYDRHSCRPGAEWCISGLDDRDVTPNPLHPLYTTDIMSKDDEVGSAFGHAAATHSFLCRRLRDHRCDYTFLPLEKAEEIESFPSLPKGHAYCACLVREGTAVTAKKRGIWWCILWTDMQMLM